VTAERTKSIARRMVLDARDSLRRSETTPEEVGAQIERSILQEADASNPRDASLIAAVREILIPVAVEEARCHASGTLKRFAAISGEIRGKK
jgi:hypothetical protein